LEENRKEETPSESPSEIETANQSEGDMHFVLRTVANQEMCLANQRLTRENRELLAALVSMSQRIGGLEMTMRVNGIEHDRLMETVDNLQRDLADNKEDQANKNDHKPSIKITIHKNIVNGVKEAFAKLRQRLGKTVHKVHGFIHRTSKSTNPVEKNTKNEDQHMAISGNEVNASEINNIQAESHIDHQQLDTIME
jgi:hypothetical protein